MKRVDANSRNKASLLGGNILNGGTVGTPSSNNTQTISSAINNNKTITLIPLDKLTPAPIQWNFFPLISEHKLLEIKFSILENKLFTPITVWEQKDGTYMILSGHNRTMIYHQILEENSDIEGFDKEEFEKIPAYIYKLHEIDELKAREIIIDTNYLQREGSDMEKLMPIIVKERMNIVVNRKDKKGKTIDIVAKELGLSRTKVYEEYLIISKIIPAFREMYFNKKLNKKPLLRLAWFSKEIQEQIGIKYMKSVSNDTLMALNKGMSLEEVEKLFEDADNFQEVKTISFKVPAELVLEAKEYMNLWLAGKIN